MGKNTLNCLEPGRLEKETKLHSALRPRARGPEVASRARERAEEARNGGFAHDFNLAHSFRVSDYMGALLRGSSDDRVRGVDVCIGGTPNLGKTHKGT